MSPFAVPSATITTVGYSKWHRNVGTAASQRRLVPVRIFIPQFQARCIVRDAAALAVCLDSDIRGLEIRWQR